MESLIIKNLLKNEDYAKQILPFLSTEYFNESNDKKILITILNFYKTYKKLPTFDEVIFDIKSKVREDFHEAILNRLNEIEKEASNITLDKLVNETELYFKNVAIQNAIIKCASMIEENNTDSFNIFPELLKKALSVSFDKSIGIDFKDTKDIIDRFNKYITRPEKIKLSTKLFNYITDGGIERKTLNLYIAPTNVGKTWKMIDDSAFLLKEGFNILYITLEMSEEKITQRIETNLFQIPTDRFKHFNFEQYKELLTKIKPNSGKKLGRLIVKEYPTSSASVAHFNILLDELEMKKDFKPDILVVDYLAIMKPLDSRYANTYEKHKFISEELRGLAVEKNLAIISAVQTNRSGFSVSDFDLTSISESIGIPFISDFIVALIRDSDLDEQNEIWVKVLKNRYMPIVNKKFNLGANVLTQSFFDVQQGEESDFKIEDEVNKGSIQKDFSKINFE